MLQKLSLLGSGLLLLTLASGCGCYQCECSNDTVVYADGFFIGGVQGNPCAPNTTERCIRYSNNPCSELNAKAADVLPTPDPKFGE